MSKHFYFYLIFLSVLLIGTLNAQSTISGYTKDGAGLPVELTQVVLLQLPDSTETAASLSDSLGWYQFEKNKKRRIYYSRYAIGL